jgi:ATP-dependent protease ClpP protease subunit
MKKNKGNKMTQKLPLGWKPVTSLLDNMQPGKEYQSILNCVPYNMDMRTEITKSLKEISDIRKRPIIAYVSNMLNTSFPAERGIDHSDDTPFLEMLKTIDANEKNLDIILVTPGGSAECVDFYVEQLRKRFDNVTFILPSMAMSAGTIFSLSGNDIIMDENAQIGPIDSQVRGKNGNFLPIQAVLNLIEMIQHRGEQAIKEGKNPNWSDVVLLNSIDPKELGNALTASQYSENLVAKYLENYKFKEWKKRSDNSDVTPEHKKQRAIEIAARLCEHAHWKTHAKPISRETAENECELKIIHPEDIPGLYFAIKRFWALMHWFFEKQTIYKVFISKEYALFRGVQVGVLPKDAH